MLEQAVQPPGKLTIIGRLILNCLCTNFRQELARQRLELASVYRIAVPNRRRSRSFDRQQADSEG